MNMRNLIIKKADQLSDEHAQRVLFEVDLEGPEAYARTEGMGLTIDVLKWINGIEANWYSFQSIRDRVIFIILYPLSVSFCHFIYDLKNVFDFPIGKGGQ